MELLPAHAILLPILLLLSTPPFLHTTAASIMSNESSSISSNKRPKLSSSSDDDDDTRANVLMVGTGEYTTGYVGGTAADSDKGAGVVALTMFDLRRRDKVNRVGMCGVNVSSCDVLLLSNKFYGLMGTYIL